MIFDINHDINLYDAVSTTYNLYAPIAVVVNETRYKLVQRYYY